jgi:hypothetical protein
MSSYSPSADSERNDLRIVMDEVEYAIGHDQVSCVRCRTPCVLFPRSFLCFHGCALEVTEIDLESNPAESADFVSACIPARVARLCQCRPQDRKALSHVTFEAGSKLSRIESYAFPLCASLSSICIPASVEILCANCFRYCRGLWSVTFGANSKLSRIETSAFQDCFSLSAIWIPLSVEILCERSFRGCKRLSGVIFAGGSKF